MISLEPLNVQERKQRLAGFYLLYALSLLTVAAMLYFVFVSWRSKNRYAPVSSISATAENVSLQPPDFIVEDLVYVSASLNSLQAIDSLYEKQLFDSTQSRMDVVASHLNRSETEFRKVVDSARAKLTANNKLLQPALLSSVMDIYDGMLKNRESLAIARKMAMLSGSGISAGDRLNLQLQYELTAKNNRIAELETQVDQMITNQNVQEIATGKTEDVQQQNKQLLNELHNKTEAISRLTAANTRLQEELKNAPGKVSAATNTVTDAQLASLQARLEQVTGDLYFTQVECNLKRIDAKQIISSARQRTELLTQSLQTLTTLSRSQNPAIQTKARQKIQELNAIAKELRD